MEQGNSRGKEPCVILATPGVWVARMLMDTLAGLLLVLLLVLANGIFVATEFSLVGARRTRIDQLAQEGNASAIAVQRAVERLDSYIASTQLGITLASLGLGWVGEPAVARLFEPL